MEQASSVESLAKTIVKQKLFTYESRLAEAKNADERNEVIQDYRKFFAIEEKGHEQIEGLRMKILASGVSLKSKARAFYCSPNFVNYDNELWVELKVQNRLTEEVRHYIKAPYDLLKVYDINDATISPDGKFIAALLEEGNARNFVAIYKNTTSGDPEYIGAIPCAIDMIASALSWSHLGIMVSRNDGNTECYGLPLINATSSSENPYKIPKLTIHTTSPLEEALEWSQKCAYAKGAAIGALITIASIKTGLADHIIEKTQSAIAKLPSISKPFKK